MQRLRDDIHRQLYAAYDSSVHMQDTDELRHLSGHAEQLGGQNVLQALSIKVKTRSSTPIPCSQDQKLHHAKPSDICRMDVQVIEPL